MANSIKDFPAASTVRVRNHKARDYTPPLEDGLNLNYTGALRRYNYFLDDEANEQFKLLKDGVIVLGSPSVMYDYEVPCLVFEIAAISFYLGLPLDIGYFGAKVVGKSHTKAAKLTITSSNLITYLFKQLSPLMLNLKSESHLIRVCLDITINLLHRLIEQRILLLRKSEVFSSERMKPRIAYKGNEVIAITITSTWMRN
jgi:hypothetical protein